MKLARFRRPLLVGAAAASLAIAGLAAPASAIVVYDPTNYAQNVLQAARALQQINNQIQSLQNEALGLLNDAKNLAQLPTSVLGPLQESVRATQTLLGEAENIAYNVADIDRQFAQKYRAIDLSASDAALVADARSRWTNSVGAFEDSLKVQAGVVGNLESSRAAMARLVDASQGAEGALGATQAGNQLLALQSQQLGDLTALVAAQGRAQALESAERAAAHLTGQEQARRFLAGGRGYVATDVKLFH